MTCVCVWGGGCRRRRTGRVPLWWLRPPRAAMRRLGPAGDGVAPRIARDLPGAKASRRAWPVPPPEHPARPSHLGPREPASEGLGGVRDFATQMKAGPSLAA